MRLMIVVLILSVGVCAASAQTVIYDVAYGTDSPLQKLDEYVASQSGSRIVVIVHGGWWVGNDKSYCSDVALRFQRAGFAVANVNYRLAPWDNVPGVTFPAQPSDLACAIAFVKQNAPWGQSFCELPSGLSRRRSERG
jgi:acetyl esterase/lipase